MSHGARDVAPGLRRSLHPALEPLGDRDHRFPPAATHPVADIEEHAVPAEREAGTLPVPAAVANAVEDALRPLGARVNRMPLNPARISDLIHRT